MRSIASLVLLVACGGAQAPKPVDTQPGHASLGRYLAIMRSLQRGDISVEQMPPRIDAELAVVPTIAPPAVAQRYQRLLDATKVIVTVGPDDPARASVRTAFPALPADAHEWSPNIVFPLFVHEAVELEM